MFLCRGSVPARFLSSEDSSPGWYTSVCARVYFWHANATVISEKSASGAKRDFIFVPDKENSFPK